MFTRSTLVMLFAAVMVAAPRAASAQGFVVIVNAANPVSELPKATVSKMFLKQQRTWPEGGNVVAIDQVRTAPARQAFSPGVHGRSVANIEEHWLQQVFAGKDEPPAQQKDDAAVMAFVASNPGAVGYVSASATLGAGVKKVTVGS